MRTDKVDKEQSLPNEQRLRGPPSDDIRVYVYIYIYTRVTFVVPVDLRSTGSLRFGLTSGAESQTNDKLRRWEGPARETLEGVFKSETLMS